MSAWIVYSKDGLPKCEARKLEYSGEFMGACSVSVNVSAPTPIGFAIGDWLEYRGERFELNYDPSAVKESSSGSYGEGFVYDNVVFNSLSDELTRCDFLDVVPADNGMHYSSLPTFSFFAESVSVLAERIQANLNRVYTGDKAWKVMVHPEFVSTKNVNVSASNLTCWDALALAKSQFDANFIIKGRTITIGTSGIAVGNLFTYGKGNGLYSIEKNAESNQKIITRLRAYGSTRNMPSGYYRKIGENVPNNMAVQNLMLPSFPTETLDPYLDSKNIEELGVREGTVFFDGSGDLEEIYPTMEGMTAEGLKEAGVNVDAEGALDVVVSAEQIEDDGIIPEEGEIQKSFTITLKDIGFDINEYLSASGTATISMKDGMCGGREFEIAGCKKDGSNYVLTCNRSEDSGLSLVFPYKDYQIKEGDKFVLLNLEMPDVYIKAASQRLLAAATEYLSKNDYVRYSYTPSVDNIYLARQHDEAVANGLKSIHDTIKEGDFILFEDDDFGISGSITIDSLSIKEYADESVIPEYEFTLREEKSVGTIEKIQNQVSSILNGSAGGSNINTEQVKSIVSAVGGSMFLSKQKDDKTEHSLSIGKDLKVGGNLGSTNFVQGNTMGSGWSIYRNANGNTVIETDNIVVRQSLKVNELVVNQETFSKGSTIYVKGGCTITEVEEFDEFYRCYYDNEGRARFSGFKIDDQARCQRYDQSYENVIKYYWRLVVGVGDDYVDLSKTDADGEGVPEVGDDIAQFGHRTDKTRQSAVILSPDNGGSVSILAGIDSFNISQKDMVGMGVNPNTGRAYLYGYGDMYFGDRNLDGNFITYQIKDGETEPTLTINADVQLGGKSTGLSNLSEFKQVQKDVNNLRGQIEREFTIWFFDPEPTLENVPAVDWVTDALKADHDQDIYYSDTLARAWRFVSGEWVEITDERTLSALKIAEEAESKAREASDYVNNVLPGKLEDIQKQIDGQIESYFYKYDPTLENEPASLWTTDELKAAHLNDTFTNLDSGYSWRWTVDNEVYGWTEIADTATVKALLAAGQAQDTADGKRRVFVNTPYVPYDEGDLWVQGSSGDILRCATPKKHDETYADSDWVKASKYTDDSALNDFINGAYKDKLAEISQQIDERAETWYQEEDPSLAWNTEELKQMHIGDLWYDKTRKQSFMWTGSEWITQGVPDEVFDTIDGKASIYTSRPNTYRKNDLWILSEDTTLDTDYKAGTIVIATENSDVFVDGHWTKRDNYTDDTRAEEAYEEAMKVKVKSESFQKELEGLGVDMEIIKQQTDREFTIWYGDPEPTLNNEPAKDWITEADKNMHDQDLYFSDSLGKAWRFVNGEWIPITDERTIAALNKAQEAYDKATNAEREAKDLTYLKLAFGDGDKENEFVGGIVMSKVVGVINDNKEVESFLNGSDFAKDDTHGKLILAGGIPSVNSDGETQLDERAKKSATRLYEDGHVVSKSADIEGTIRVGTMVYKTLYGAGGDLTGYSMAVGTQGGTFSFLLPQITDEDFIEVKVVWFGLSRLATTYYVMAKDGREINYKSGGEFVSTTELNIKGDTFYKFFSVRGKWYVSTENILSL